MITLPPPGLPEPPDAPAPPEPEPEQTAAPEATEATDAAEAAEAIQGESAAAPDEAADTPADESPDAVTHPKRRRNNFNSLEIAAQIHQVQEWITAGYRPNAIRRLCEDEWGLTQRVAETRIASARRQIVADVNMLDRQSKVGQMIEQLEEVLKMSMKSKQGSNCIGALRLQADLLQLLSRQN